MPIGEGTGKRFRSSIGGRVLSARSRLGWSREALAYRSGLSWSAIEQIESGRRQNNRPDTLKKLSQALGVTIDYLVTGASPPKMLSHQVFVYGHEDAFLATAVPFLNDGMERSEILMAVTTRKNIGFLRDELGQNADQVEFIEAETMYSSPVAALNAYGALLDDKLAQGAPWVRIVGDPGWPGRSEAEIRAWNQYESLVNLAFGPAPITFLCTYDERSINPALVATSQLTHPWIVEGHTVTENPMFRDPAEFVLGHD